MSVFAPLRDELATWRAAGLTLPLWWRDDDATTPSDPLDRLLAMSGEIGLAVHLAVIPEPATKALAARLEGSAAVVLVHGWAHCDHAPPGRKKAEFGHPRDGAVQEAERALRHIEDVFGNRHLPLFVPPWNRIDAGLVAALSEAGYAALSTYTPRPAREAAPGLVQINCHVDPINWRGGGGLADPEAQIAALVAHLRDRRAGRADAAEPLGFLSHHLVHDAEIWDFARACLDCLLDGGAAPINLLTLKDNLP